MTILDFLSQELQIAVDAMKSAYPHNDVRLKAVGDYLNTLPDSGQVPWLKDFKAEQTYVSRPCNVAPDAIDTVSRLVRFVNSYWLPANLETNIDINSFATSLFSSVTVATQQQDFAFAQRKGYGSDMPIAIEWKNNNDGDTTKIREVSAKYQALKDSALEQLAQPDGSPYSAKSWAAAFWSYCTRISSITCRLYSTRISLNTRQTSIACCTLFTW